MDCFNCHTEMASVQVLTKKAQVSYNICEKCGSLWLDAGELDKMAFQVEGSIEYCEKDEQAEPEKQERKCPRCQDFLLQKIRFLGCDDITLHFCQNCRGFWLDGGELNLVDKELAKIMPVAGRGFSDFVNNVHVPYWFKRIQRKSSETDFYVDVPPIRGAQLEKAASDRCPACGTGLNVYEFRSMRFEGCPKCKGMWLVKDELRRLKNKVEDGNLRWLNDEIENIERASVIAAKRPCVNCKNVNMVSVLFGKSSLVIDWCQKCHGMWLDRGEFEALIEYLKQESGRMKPKVIERHAAADLKRVWSGGPESRLDEALDAEAAVSALINATIFEHPALSKFCMGFPHLLG
jgi:Zn-finger nucleic acid-binding protein